MALIPSTGPQCAVKCVITLCCSVTSQMVFSFFAVMVIFVLLVAVGATFRSPYLPMLILYLYPTMRFYEEGVADARSCYTLFKLLFLTRATMSAMVERRSAAVKQLERCIRLLPAGQQNALRVLRAPFSLSLIVSDALPFLFCVHCCSRLRITACWHQGSSTLSSWTLTKHTLSAGGTTSTSLIEESCSQDHDPTSNESHVPS